MGRLLAQALVHALVAALVVEALVRAWREDVPGRRMRLRALVLAAAFAAPTLDELLPIRREEWFGERHALLAIRHWTELAPAGVPSSAVFLGALALAGFVLFLADALPVVRERLSLSKAAHAPAARRPELEVLVSQLAHTFAIAPPPLVVAATRAPLLLCRGVRAPALVVSEGALGLLDAEELRAAVAHELAHLRARDTRWSWVLFAVRGLQAFNPVVQLVVRAMAQDAERRADDAAGEAAGDRVALASAILKLGRAGLRQGDPALTVHGRVLALRGRCRRLLDGPAPQPPALPVLRVAAAAIALVGLLVFVV